MCATTVQTREARQHTNHVEVFLGSSQQISTVDIVTVWRRGGDYIALFSATLLFSVTSFVKPAFSVVYDRISAVASVSPVPSSLSYGHRKCPKKVT